MSNHRRVRLVVSGRVQGVGFRYFTQRQGERHGLVGWVKNLPCGNVETEAQGDAGLVDEFIRAVGRGPSSAQVVNVQITDVPLNDRDEDFSIRMF